MPSADAADRQAARETTRRPATRRCPEPAVRRARHQLATGWRSRHGARRGDGALRQPARAASRRVVRPPFSGQQGAVSRAGAGGGRRVLGGAPSAVDMFAEDQLARPGRRVEEELSPRPRSLSAESFAPSRAASDSPRASVDPHAEPPTFPTLRRARARQRSSAVHRVARARRFSRVVVVARAHPLDGAATRDAAGRRWVRRRWARRRTGEGPPLFRAGLRAGIHERQSEPNHTLPSAPVSYTSVDLETRLGKVGAVFGSLLRRDGTASVDDIARAGTGSCSARRR